MWRPAGVCGVRCVRWVSVSQSAVRCVTFRRTVRGVMGVRGVRGPGGCAARASPPPPHPSSRPSPSGTSALDSRSTESSPASPTSRCLLHHLSIIPIHMCKPNTFRLPFQPLETDGLPDNICSSCMDKIKIAYDIIVQSEKSELVLKKSVDWLYRRFKNISLESSLLENETILVVVHKSEVMDDEECHSKTLQDKPLDVGDDLFIFTLGKDGQLQDLNTLKFDLEMFKIKEENGDDVDLSTIKEEPELDYESSTLDVKREPLESDDESSRNSESSNLENVDDSSIFIIDEPHPDLNSVELISSDIYYDSLNDSNDVKNVFKFDCSMCNESFVTKGELKSHMSQHPKGTKHVCRICSKSYRKISILKRHYVTHREQKNYACSLCSQVFPNESSLNAHVCHRDVKKCMVCDVALSSEYALFEHLKTEHSIESEVAADLHKNGDDKFDCTMCHDSFDNPEALKEHKKSHPEGSRHVCRICDKTYLEVSTLKRHMIVHTGKKTYLCPVCGKSFFYRNVLKSHMVYHSEKKHRCHLCDKRFHMRHMLREHVRMSHSNNRYNFMCDTCGKLCSSGRRFAIHKESHNVVSCPTCGKLYRNVRYYKQHLKLHNGITTPKKLFICDYCGEKRTLKTLIELHILSKHLNERRYQCKLCDKAFFSKGSLSEHEVVHSRKKSETCGVCGRILVNRKALILHNRLHTGERPYPCSMCGDRFLSSSRRLAHIKSKHGERTEHCTICPSKFHLRSDLNKHMLVHSKEPKKPKKEFIFNMP